MALSLYQPEAHAIVRHEPMHPVRVQNAITVADLRASMRQREETQRAGYAAALERCYSRVRRCASVGRTECVFQVPHAVAGMPLYDVIKCANFVVAHLKKNGFRVTVGDVDGFELHVSWDVGIEEEDDRALAEAVEATDRGMLGGGTKGNRWFDKSALFAARRFDNQVGVRLPQAPPPVGAPQFETQTPVRRKHRHQDDAPPGSPFRRGSSSSQPPTTTSFGSAFGGLSQMSRDEQTRHIDYLNQQQVRFASESPAPMPAAKSVASVQPQQQRSSSPGFLRSIAEFKPSGKFVLRV